MRSARPLIAVAALASLTVPLAGCVTTQQRNERARLRATRLLASRQRLDLGAGDAAARVDAVALVRDRRRGAAVVVELTNPTPRPLADVPIAVGVQRPHGRTRWLNRHGGRDYLDAHVASLPAHGRVRWVFTTQARLPRSAHAVAAVGVPGPRLRATPPSLPQLDVRATGAAAPGDDVALALRNASAVPQYDVPVYAVARRGGRFVAAGRATVAHVGSAAATTLRLHLVGRPVGAHIETTALPSIFR